MYAIFHMTVKAEAGISAFADSRDRLVHQMLNEVYLLPAMIFPNDTTQIHRGFLHNSGEKIIVTFCINGKKIKKSTVLFNQHNKNDL